MSGFCIQEAERIVMEEDCIVHIVISPLPGTAVYNGAGKWMGMIAGQVPFRSLHPASSGRFQFSLWPPHHDACSLSPGL